MEIKRCQQVFEFFQLLFGSNFSGISEKSNYLSIKNVWVCIVYSKNCVSVMATWISLWLQYLTRLYSYQTKITRLKYSGGEV